MLRTKLIILLSILIVACCAQFSWAYPPAGYDVISTSARVEIFDPADSSLWVEDLMMGGYAVIWRSDPYDTGDGTMRIDTRMDTLILRGHSPTFNDSVFITLNRAEPSLGAIIQQNPGVDFPAESFFDVYYQISFTTEPDPPKVGAIGGGPGTTYRGGFDLDLESQFGQLGSNSHATGGPGRAARPDGVSVELSGYCQISSLGISAGLPFNIDVYFTTYRPENVKGIANGFRIYSPEGASWTPPVATSDADFCSNFDLICGTYGFSLTGSGSDTIGIGGSVMTQPGLPPGWSGLALSIATQVDTLEIGDHLCIDSCYFPPAGSWTWAYGSPVGSIPPPWGGPYCWEIIRNTCVGPPPEEPPHMSTPIGGIPPHGYAYQDPRKTPIVDAVTGDTLAWIWHEHRAGPPKGGNWQGPTWGSMEVIIGPDPPTPSQPPDELIILQGDALISWGDSYVNAQNRWEEYIQLAEMNLTGESRWGPAYLTLAPDLGQSDGLSTGQNEGEMWPQDSYLDVYYQVEFPEEGLVIIPEAGPPHMVADAIGFLPPFNAEFYDPDWHAIVDRVNPTIIIGWVRPIHWVQPPQTPGACCDTVTKACRVTIPALCIGPNDIYMGDNTICNPNPCICCMGEIRGNVDYDPGDVIDIADLVYLVDWMFNGGPTPPCFEETDMDCSGTIDIGDLVYLVDYMFNGGPEPCPCDCSDPCAPPTLGSKSAEEALMKWSALVNPQTVPPRCLR